MKTLALTSLLILLFSSYAHGAGGGYLRFQPIIGLERVQKLTPVVKTKTRTIAGLRMLFGPSWFAFEAEGTRSDDSEFIAEDNLTEKERSYAVKVGLRAGFNIGVLGWYMRGGGQARRSEFEVTQNGVVTERDPAVYVAPYAGTGFRLNLAGNLFANGGVTVIFTGRPKGSDREYQTTLGFGVRL